MKRVILLGMTLPLTISWRLGYLFSEDVNYAVNWFLLKPDYYQHPYYYFHQTSFHLTNIILSYIIYDYARQTKLHLITVVYLFFSILRLIEYWLTAGQAPIWQTLGCMAVFTMLYTWRR